MVQLSGGFLEGAMGEAVDKGVGGCGGNVRQ